MVYQRKYDYEYREGWRPGVDANTVGGMMEQIEEKHGAVTSELFLEASREESSPTHDVFEWNDGAAAEKYRLHQASCTIRAVRVIVKEDPRADPKDPKNPEAIKLKLPRAFVNIVEDDSKKAKYMNVRDAMADAEIRFTVLSRAVRELKVFEEKYASLVELAEVFSAIDRILLRDKDHDEETDGYGDFEDEEEELLYDRD